MIDILRVQYAINIFNFSHSLYNLQNGHDNNIQYTLLCNLLSVSGPRKKIKYVGMIKVCVMLTYFAEQILCRVLVITPGPLLPQRLPRKFFIKSRMQASATRRPNVVVSMPIAPAATSSQSSAPAKFVNLSKDLPRKFV